jgi:hypothetical protein
MGQGLAKISAPVTVLANRIMTQFCLAQTHTYADVNTRGKGGDIC